MATTLADPSTAADAERASAPVASAEPAAPSRPPQPAAAPPPIVPAERACANCGSPMGVAQDWCLQCGAGAPGSLGASAPSWRSGATVLIATAVLALGAAAAGYAALSKGERKARVVTTTVAQTPAPAGAAGTTPTTPTTLGTPTTVKPALPSSTVKPPKIPLTAVTPKANTTPTTTTPSSTESENGTNTSSTTTTPTTSTGGATPNGEPQPAAILLDTNAAQTYNPYAYPVSDFGDPSLTIDGDTSTGWTAQLEPSMAPKMAEGLVIDLKTGRKLSALALVTSTPGMTVQVFGANGHTLPASITDPAWVKLSHAVVEKSKHVRLKLRESKKAFRFVTLWISKAPAASVGTAQAPGHVSVNELELFPTS